MTKKEIVKTISEEIGLTQLKTKEIVQKTFDAIVETLVDEKRIELRNFGVFEVKKRAARKARNPRTGEKVFVPAKFVVTFKPGKEMEERVHELERRAARVAAQQAKRKSQELVDGSSAIAVSSPPSPIPRSVDRSDGAGASRRASSRSGLVVSAEADTLGGTWRTRDTERLCTIRVPWSRRPPLPQQ